MLLKFNVSKLASLDSLRCPKIASIVFNVILGAQNSILQWPKERASRVSP